MRSVFSVRNILLCLCILPFFAHAQPGMTFQGGVWLKFKVKENGIYKIGFNDLRNAGVDPASINPGQIGLYTFPTGMLPQPNSTPRPDNNVEVAISVTGQEDGKFDSGDEIFFYGEGPDQYSYNGAKGVFFYENNLYADENYYFLRIGSLNGSRIQKSALTAGTRSVHNEYVDFGYYEKDLYNDLKSGRDWFGEQFEVKNEITIRFDMPGIIPGSDIRFVSNLMAQSYEYCSFKLSWNDTQILDRQMDTIPQTTYGSKGAFGIDTLTFGSSSVNAPSSNNQDIKINFTKGGGNRSVGYLNYILFTVKRKIAAYTNTTFIHLPPLEDAEHDLQVASFPSEGIVWDITDPFNAEEMNVSVAGDIGMFPATNGANRFVVFTKDAATTPEFVENVPDQALHDLSTPSLIIVTHDDFLSEANRLASHRAATYGLDVKVVTVQQIYNEFSGGRQDITAIRDFVRSLYLKTPGKLKNLLLFGRGSYDYKDRVFNNTNFVPIYESRNSLEPLLTYSSDDYYGFLDTNEGFWSETGNDHTLDIGVGRLPVATLDQATNIVDKLIVYDKSAERSLWKQRVLFVADDGDWNIHQSQAEDLAELFEVQYKNYHTSKIYLDAFEQENIPSGQQSPKAKAALALELDKGYDIINYTGHGSERVWMQERILDPDTPLGMRNGTRLPLFITATCEFGRHDDPLLTSTAEMLLERKNGGAIGLVTTARPVNTITNSVLNRAFYAAYFEETTEVKDLGSIFMKTKNDSKSGVANRNFSILGDPSMRFDPPKEKIAITSLQTSDGSDVLKSLSKVTLMGEIRMYNNLLSTTFNGTVDIELFDRRSELTTLGDENAPFIYRVWDHSLFRGKASVVNGEFAAEFILPEGVSENIQNGKILMYAYTSDRGRDAQGTVQNIKVGGIDPNPGADITGPSIELYMGDSTFVDGGFTNSDTYLVGKLYDKSGMNISGYGDGVMTAVLDDDKTFIVNDYFVANEDDFTTGWFSYPVSGLEEGQHTIRFTATDTYGNPGTASITFMVGKDGALVIEDVYAYPNPFTQSNPAMIEFRHNRTGEDLEVQVVIYDALGQLADRRAFTISASTYKVPLFDWNGYGPNGAKMANGIYLVKLVVRSLTDGAKNDKLARLILTN